MTSRPMTEADIPDCLILSRSVSWPHEANDWAFTVRTGRGLVIEERGAILGTGVWWPFGEDFASLGMLIVSPGRQGSGIGKLILTELLAQVGNRSCRLYATNEGLPLYAKFRFTSTAIVGSYRGNCPRTTSVCVIGSQILRKTNSEARGTLFDLDFHATGLDRREILGTLLETGEAVSLTEDGKCIGFSIARRSGQGVTIGPVVAPTLQHATILVQHWFFSKPGSIFRIDTHDEEGLGTWLSEQGLLPRSNAQEMEHGEFPTSTGPVFSFALINQAIG